MAATSLKGLSSTVDWVKRGNMFLVAPEHLVEEPGFNLRMERPDLEEYIESLTQHLMNGGTVPPLEVIYDPARPDEVPVRDGHCRRRAIFRAIERGMEIPFVQCVQFRGGNADQIVLMLTRGNSRPLLPLEVAEGYLRLLRLNFSATDIATRVGKTAKHVEQMLVLAEANEDVKDLVKNGTVSATLAIETVQQYGSKAGEVLSSGLERAQASGKTKVTKAVVKGKNPPSKVVRGVLSSYESFTARLEPAVFEQLSQLGELPEEERQGKTIAVSVDALLELLEAKPALQAFREKMNQATDEGADGSSDSPEGQAVEGADGVEGAES